MIGTRKFTRITTSFILASFSNHFMCRCHVSLTTDRELSKLLSCLHKIKIGGSPKFSDAILVAHVCIITK